MAETNPRHLVVEGEVEDWAEPRDDYGWVQEVAAVYQPGHGVDVHAADVDVAETRGRSAVGVGRAEDRVQRTACGVLGVDQVPEQVTADDRGCEAVAVD